MNKKQQEEQRRREDQALKQGLLWAAGAVVLEVLLFFVNRYAIDFDATSQGAELAGILRSVLGGMRLVGAAAMLLGVALFVMRVKKGAKTNCAVAVCAAGAAVMLCAHVALKYQNSGMRMLFLLVPMLGGLALSYYIYQHEFFFTALPGVFAALGLWFVRAGGVGAEAIGTLLFCVAVLVAVLKLKKGAGCLKAGEESLRLLPEKTNYTVVLGSCAAAIAVQLLAAVAGGAVAYYLIFAVGAWLFALLVYYTVKML